MYEQMSGTPSYDENTFSALLVGSSVSSSLMKALYVTEVCAAYLPLAAVSVSVGSGTPSSEAVMLWYLPDCV